MRSQHSHNHADFAALRKKSKSAMLTVLVLTLTYMVVEVIAGLYTGSLALIADAGHMLGDVGALLLALLAVWFSSRTPSESKTYGYYRTEILAALINSVLLISLSGYILFEACKRFTSPPEILSTPMLLVAIGGLVINLIAVKLLSDSSEHSLNAKAAYLEVVGDLLGSTAVIAAGVIMMLTGWSLADPIISALIGLMILPRTWLLVQECVHILMEGAPGHISLSNLRTAILRVPGVIEVHDLHVWTITSAKDAMSAHVLVEKSTDVDAVLTQITTIAQDNFDLHHTTIQIEQVECKTKDGTCLQ